MAKLKILTTPKGTALLTNNGKGLTAWRPPATCNGQNTEFIEISHNYFKTAMTRETLLDYRVDQVIDNLWEKGVRDSFISAVKTASLIRSPDGRYKVISAIVSNHEEHTSAFLRAHATKESKK